MASSADPTSTAELQSQAKAAAMESAAAQAVARRTTEPVATLAESASAVQRKSSGLPVVACMPGCTKDHKHVFEYDYTKNHCDPIDERPGYFKEFNWELVDKTIKLEKNQASNSIVKFDTTGASYDLSSFGREGTPINLDTSIKILEDFQDNAFKVKYAKIDAKSQTKYKE